MKDKVSMFSVFLLVIAPLAFCVGNDYSNSILFSCPWAGEDKTICRGECVEIGCDLEELDQDLCFSWQPTSSISPNDSPHSQMIEVCPEVTTTYKIYITNPDGNLIGEDEITVFVEEVDMEITTSTENMICKGDIVSLSASIIGGIADPDSFQWSDGQNGATIDVAPEYTTIYEVECIDINTGCTLREEVMVRVHDFPEIKIISSVDVICEEAMEGVNNSATGRSRSGTCEDIYTFLTVTAHPNFQYLWSTGETASSIRVFEATEYFVTVTNTINGCELVASHTVGSCVETSILPLSIENGNGEEVSYLGTDSEFIRYEWSTGALTQTIPVENPGLYSITVVNENNCQGRAEFEVTNCDDDVYGLYIIYHANNDATREQYLFITNSGTGSDDQPLLTDQSKIEELITNDKQRLRIPPPPLVAGERYTIKFIWIDSNGQGINEIQSSDEHLLLPTPNSNSQWIPMIIKWNAEGNPEVYYQCSYSPPNWQSRNFVTRINVNANGFDYSETHNYYTLSYPFNRNDNMMDALELEAFPNVLNLSFEVEKIEGGVNTATGLTNDIQIQYHQEQEQEQEEYVITRNGQQVTSVIEEEIGTPITFGIAKVDENGELLPVNNMGDHGVNDIFWNMNPIRVLEDQATFSISVPEIAIISNQILLRLTINSTEIIDVYIDPQEQMIEPGIHVDPTNEDNPLVDTYAKNCTTDQEIELKSYVERALVRIQEYENENENFELYDLVTGGNPQRGINIHLVEGNHPSLPVVEGGTTYGATDANLNVIEDRLSLATDRILENSDGCPIDALFYMTIAEDLVDNLEELIRNNTQESIIPIEVDKIRTYNPEVGDVLLSWLNLSDVTQVELDNAVQQLRDREAIDALGYVADSPEDRTEVETVIEDLTQATIYLNYEALGNPELYGNLIIDRATNPQVLDLETNPEMSSWYEGRGENGRFPSTVTGFEGYRCNHYQFALDKFRMYIYTNNLSHELGHVKFPIINKYEAYKWQLITSHPNYEALYEQDICYPRRNGADSSYCSEASGHEIGNPGNTVSCEAEVVEPGLENSTDRKKVRQIVN